MAELIQISNWVLTGPGNGRVAWLSSDDLSAQASPSPQSLLLISLGRILLSSCSSISWHALPYPYCHLVAMKKCVFLRYPLGSGFSNCCLCLQSVFFSLSLGVVWWPQECDRCEECAQVWGSDFKAISPELLSPSFVTGVKENFSN